MLKDTLAKMEAALSAADSLPAGKKADLTRLLSKLKGEVERLAKTHGEHARSIAGFAEAATHEATRKQKAPSLRKLTEQGLSSSVAGFEASHPVLVETANEVCTLLSRLGI